MAKIIIIWTERASIELYEILDYYAYRNKCKIYSIKLHKEIQNKLKILDFTITLPQKKLLNQIFFILHTNIFFCFFLLLEIQFM